MIIFDKIENLSRYPKYIRVYNFLKENAGKILSDGKHIIDENCYVAVSEYNTNNGEGLFEGHRKYIDLQMVVEGEEYVRVQNLDDCILKVDYDDAKDVVFYDANSWHNIYLTKGYFLVLEENDLHKPGVCITQASKVKKYVFKIGV